MAIIYGISQSERNVIEHTPDSVRKIDDVDTVHKELANELESKKKDFFGKLPTKIQEKENILEKIKNEQITVNQDYAQKIKNLEDKKSEGALQSISSHFKIAVLKNYSKPKKLHKIQALEHEQKDSLSKWKNNPQGIFDEISKNEREEVERFGQIKKSPEYIGALGEVSVLKKLSQLSDDYHVFCDVQIELPYYVTYNRRKNLKSAQMDFVVVSKRGVILIEVKNWTDTFVFKNRKNGGLEPHEQVERAGRVLWISLKSWRSPKNPSVTSVLLATRGNMKYDSSYKFVAVKDLSNIISFIQKRKEDFTDKEVERIVGRIKGHVTN